jgi:hypothetical protein
MSDSSSPQNPDTLIYGVFQAEEVAFIPRRRALELALVWRALDSAQTWGDFKRIVPAHIYEEVVEALKESSVISASDREPDADAPFYRDDIPGHADGDWPPYPPQQMLDWVPQDIQTTYGKIVTTPFNGDYLYFPAGETAKVLAALAAYGYTFELNENLVKDASGH